MRSPGESTSRSPPSSLVARSSKRFHVVLELVPCFAGPKPKIPFLVVRGLSLLRNHMKRLATQAIAHQVSTLRKRSRNSDWGVSRSLVSLLMSRNDLL